jgi:hypothetical protein
VSGWCGYFLAGKAAPAGRILVFDDDRLYGFGRKPQYYRWTTPIEHHLFCADKLPPAEGSGDAGPEPTLVRVANSPSLNPAGKPITVEAWVKAERPDGVVLARGGSVHGYALYLRGGRPHFAVRVDKEPRVAASDKKVAGRWVHLAGVLTAEKQVRVYVDGKLAASAQSPGLVAADPADAMEIGADENSTVGDYPGPFRFDGLIDEVRVYHRTLGDDEIQERADGDGRGEIGDAELVLDYAFDKPGAADASGHENHGEVEGAASVEGQFGRALRFTGGPSRPKGFLVDHHWSKDVPLFARAMALADGTLFLAGPADTVDEEQAFRRFDEPEVKRGLLDQAVALEGKKGAVLWAVSTDGEKLAEQPLDAPPVFDGMAVAAGRLYLAAAHGSVVCFEGR